MAGLSAHCGTLHVVSTSLRHQSMHPSESPRCAVAQQGTGYGHTWFTLRYLLAHHVFMAHGNWLDSEDKLTRELDPALVTQSKEASSQGRTTSCCSVSDLRYLFTRLSSRNTQTPPDLIIGPGLGSFLLSLREWLTPRLLRHTRETTL